MWSSTDMIVRKKDEIHTYFQLLNQAIFSFNSVIAIYKNGVGEKGKVPVSKRVW